MKRANRTMTKPRQGHEEIEAYKLGLMIQELRHDMGMTQEQLAEKTGTKKSFISRIENGHSDIQLSTLYKLFETGLGRTVKLSIQ